MNHEEHDYRAALKYGQTHSESIPEDRLAESIKSYGQFDYKRLRNEDESNAGSGTAQWMVSKLKSLKK